MGSLVYEYLLFVANDVIFFSDDVKTTTIAVAIASSLCCSIVWAIFHIIGVTRPSKTELKTKSNILSVYDEKHTIQRFYTRKQPCTDSHESTVLHVHGDNVDVPCVRCGKFFADASCRFVTCKNCCFSRTACNFHLQNDKIKCRTYLKNKDRLLQEIDLSDCDIGKCPDRLGFVGAQLTLLNLSHNKLTFLPTEIGCLRGLKELNVGHNSISSIPDTLCSLENVETLNISFNQITDFPDSLCYLPKLKFLEAGHNFLVNLPECIGHMQCLISLFVEHNKLTCLNTQCLTLKSLVTLVLHNNPMTGLPDEIRNMIGLQVLDISHCHLEQIPQGLCHCPKLKLLDLSYNRISWLPVEMGIMHCLQILHLDNNRLSCLPSTLVVDRLEAITVSGNPFHDTDHKIYIPETLFPSLLELTLRFVGSHGNFQIDYLPRTLKNTLEMRNTCTGCGQRYFNFYKSSVRLQQTTEGNIPFYSQICSPHLKHCCDTVFE